jgi:hypothetical protein
LLANLYYRRGNVVQFGRWAHDALWISYADPAPLYRLCWQMSDDGAAIDRIIPDRPQVLRSYLRFLLAEDKLADARTAAARLLPQAVEEDTPELLSYCDRLLETRRVAPAIEIWNRMCRRGLLPYPPPTADIDTVTNADFAHESIGRGFDWRLSQIEGVTMFRSRMGGLHILFSGRQPEQCELAAQLISVTGRGRRRLRFAYRTSGISGTSGLRWAITDVLSGAEIPVAGDALSAESWTWGEARFSQPPGLRLARIALVYCRVPGTIRIEGTLDLRHVELEPGP